MEFLLINGSESCSPLSLKTKYKRNLPVFPPLGLLYIGRSLEDDGHHVEILDFFVEKNPFKELKKLVHNVDVVGISVDREYYNESEGIARTIKEIDSSIPIVIGGPYCTLYPKKSLVDLPSVDISVQGEGETAIKDVAKALSGDIDLSVINGIHYRENDRIKPGKPPCINEDLDSLSFPARRLVDKYEYGKLGDTYFYRQKVTSMITSRGCPFRCRFCVRHTISHKFRKRSVKNVMDELQEINGKYDTVIIADDTFLSDNKRAEEILDKIITMEPDMDLWVSTRVDVTDKEIYKKMKKAGVKYVAFGIESGNQDVLDFYDKGITLDQIIKAVKLSSKMGFISSGNFILGAPIETKEHIENSIKFACSLPLEQVGFSTLEYRYGSDLWIEAVNKGLIDKNENEVVADSNRGLANFSKEELQEFCNIGLRRFYFRPKYYVQQLAKAIYRRDFRILRIGMNMFFNKSPKNLK